MFKEDANTTTKISLLNGSYSHKIANNVESTNCCILLVTNGYQQSKANGQAYSETTYGPRQNLQRNYILVSVVEVGLIGHFDFPTSKNRHTRVSEF